MESKKIPFLLWLDPEEKDVLKIKSRELGQTMTEYLKRQSGIKVM